MNELKIKVLIDLLSSLYRELRFVFYRRLNSVHLNITQSLISGCIETDDVTFCCNARLQKTKQIKFYGNDSIREGDRIPAGKQLLAAPPPACLPMPWLCSGFYGKAGRRASARACMPACVADLASGTSTSTSSSSSSSPWCRGCMLMRTLSYCTWMDGCTTTTQRQTDGDTQYTHQIIIKIPCRLAASYTVSLPVRMHTSLCHHAYVPQLTQR